MQLETTQDISDIPNNTFVSSPENIIEMQLKNIKEELKSSLNI